MRLWRMHGDYAANHIKYNGNDVVDCFYNKFHLAKMSGGKVMVN